MTDDEDLGTCVVEGCNGVTNNSISQFCLGCDGPNTTKEERENLYEEYGKP